MGVVVEGSTPADAATKANLDSFITQVGAPFTYTIDATPTGLEDLFGVLRDTFVILDLSTMKILRIIDNFNGGGGIDTALPAFEALLQ